MWDSKKLKNTFLEYFQKSGHEIINSSSVVPYNDDTLLFANSGMVQFKANFLGIENKFSDLKRACSSQRCIRAGGKHNDLDDVGKDTYHHTFFEMLGNWSFDDYFKAEAIDMAWDFLINLLNLPKEQIYVTYFSDENSEIANDVETREFWRKYLPDERIIKGNVKDNFWEMGDSGPCGPCSEIHFDRIGGRVCSDRVNMDDPDVIEIWNIVFMEYEKSGGKLKPLKKKCIDTGIGFERLLSIINNYQSNYQTDLFLPLFEFITAKGGAQKYTDTISGESASIDCAYRVVADHSRTIAVCINDGVRFSNEGRGYVLRRICRRAIRYGTRKLNLSEGVIAELVGLAAETLGITLSTDQLDLVIKEEKLFLRTLSKGVAMFDKMIAKSGKLSRSDVFMLYDTYGFPFDLTKIMADELSIAIDEDAFVEEVKKAKLISKQNKSKAYNFIQPDNKIVTDDSYKYDSNNIIARMCYKAESDNLIGCIFDRTCFYCEMGGQVGDSGKIDFFEEKDVVGTLNVIDTKNIAGNIFHIGTLSGKTTNEAVLCYDEERRDSIKRNHSGTHILNYFLSKIVKDQTIKQCGSVVEPEKLRFDFSCGRALTLGEISSLEEHMNNFIGKGLEQVTVVVKLSEVGADTIKMEGEYYPESVRMITFHHENDYIKELCGGTHVSNSNDIQLIRIISESSISANTRRIVAMTGEEALRVTLVAQESIKLGITDVKDEIPLVEKRRIDDMKTLAIKDGISKKNILLKQTIGLFNIRVAEFKIGSLKIKENESFKDIFQYIFDSSEYEEKDIQKILSKMVGVIKKDNICGVIYTVMDDLCHFAIYSKDKMNLLRDSKCYKINDVIFGKVSASRLPEFEENVVKCKCSS